VCTDAFHKDLSRAIFDENSADKRLFLERNPGKKPGWNDVRRSIPPPEELRRRLTSLRDDYMEKKDSTGKTLFTEATLELWNRQLKLVADNRLGGTDIHSTNALLTFTAVQQYIGTVPLQSSSTLAQYRCSPAVHWHSTVAVQQYIGTVLLQSSWHSTVAA
jgi:hypothetical protein